MKKSLVLVAIAALLAGTTAFANDADKGTVKCKDSKGKVSMVKSAEECTKAGGTVEK